MHFACRSLTHAFAPLSYISASIVVRLVNQYQRRRLSHVAA